MTTIFPNVMTTDDYSDYNDLTQPGMFQPVSNSSVIAFSQVFLPTLYTIVFIVGFIGNGLVICVLVKYHKTSNMSDVCLFNLALSDLLFLFSLPFWAHYAAVSEWIFGSFMCHAVNALYMLGFYGSIFFMILMTVDRYAAIVHASSFLSSKHCSFRARIMLVVLMWALSLGASLPTIVFLKGQNESDVQACRVEYPQGSVWKLVSYIELNVLGLIIPLSVMVFCYSRIIPILMTMKSEKKHKAVRLMVVLVAVFFLFWTPYNIVIFLMILQEQNYTSISQEHMRMAVQWVETIAFSHCCLNPIIYAFMGQKFRNSLLRILKEWFPCCFSQCRTTESVLSWRLTSVYSSAIFSTKTKYTT